MLWPAGPRFRARATKAKIMKKSWNFETEIGKININRILREADEAGAYLVEIILPRGTAWFYHVSRVIAACHIADRPFDLIQMLPRKGYWQTWTVNDNKDGLVGTIADSTLEFVPISLELVNELQLQTVHDNAREKITLEEIVVKCY